MQITWAARGSPKERDSWVGRSPRRSSRPLLSGVPVAHDPNYTGVVDTVYLGCWPRKVFDRIGLFDEELVRNQDDEFNLRLTRAGGKIWQSPRIKSWYHPRKSLGSLLQQQMQYGYWKVRVIQKHKIPASIRHLVPGCFVLSLIFLALASPWSRVALWGWIGLAGLYLLCNLVASILTAARAGWTLLPTASICVCLLSFWLWVWISCAVFWTLSFYGVHQIPLLQR